MESLLRRLESTPTPARYAITIALVLLTFGLRLGVPAGDYGFILFIPVIVVAGFLFNRANGFLALTLSAALIAGQLVWHETPHLHIAALASFILVGSGLVFLSEGLHRALERAYKAEGAKDLLLQEMSHRVKNKFTLIASMIELQGRNSQAPEARTALESIGARVRVITRVHDYLQLSRMDGVVDVRQYLEGLCRSLEETLQNLRPVHISVIADELSLPPEKALPLGLIVNELVTNAVKYAFPDGKEGSVQVRLQRCGGVMQLSVLDDGIGCPDTAPAGLGTKLVKLLAAQLGGSAKWEAADRGCHASTEFSA